MTGAFSAKALAGFVLLSLVLLSGAQPGVGLVLCRAPGRHVAIEDAISSARCHRGTESPAPATTGGALLELASEPCVDAPLVPPALRAADVSRAQSHGAAIAPAVAVTSPASFRVVDRSPLRRSPAPDARSGFRRILRTTVLLV